MNCPRILPFLVICAALNLIHLKFSYAQQNEKQKETLWDKTQKYTNIATGVASSFAPLLDALGGDSSGIQKYVDAYTQTTGHPQFPSCRIMPTVPQLTLTCTSRPTLIKDPLGKESLAENTNDKAIANLTFLRGMYAQGKNEFDNNGNKSQGVACLKNQLNDISKSFEKINKTLDDAITQFKLDARALEESMAQQKKALKVDYEVLFKGSDDNTFNPITQILDVPGCESLFENESLRKTYLGQGPAGSKAGLLGIREADSTSDRIKNSTEFNKNSHVIYSDLNKMMNSFSKKLSSMTSSDIVNGSGITEELKDGTTDLTQYKFLNSPSFQNSLKEAVNNVRTERQEIIGRFKSYLGNTPEDQIFLSAIQNASEKSNLKAQFTNWKNGKELSCIREKILGGSANKGSTADIINKLIADGRPSRKKMANKPCLSNDGCKSYINNEISKLFTLYENSGTTTNNEEVKSRISKISAVKTDLTQSVYTFSLNNSSGNRVTLGKLLQTYRDECQNEIQLNENAEYNYVANKIMPQAIDELSKFDKEIKKSVVKNIHSEIFDCGGKAVNYNSCENVLPGASGSFCYNQAMQCSQNINKCQTRVDGLIQERKNNITSNIKNMNDKVELLNSHMFQDLQLKMKTYSSFIDSTLVGLSQWAGFKSSPNDFNIKKISDKDMNVNEYKELTEPPFNLSILSPEKTVEQYAEAIDVLKEKNEEMLSTIKEKFNEEIKGIQNNYNEALKSIDAAIAACSAANEKISKYLADRVDVCKKTESKEKAQEAFSDLMGSKYYPGKEKTCEKVKELDLNITRFKRCDKANGALKTLKDLCNNQSPDESKISSQYEQLQTAAESCVEKEEATKCDSVQTSNDPSLVKREGTPKGDPKKTEKKEIEEK